MSLAQDAAARFDRSASTDGTVRRRELAIRTADGLALPGTLYEPHAAASGPAVLLSSGAAVERRFYRAFAEHLVERGARAVLTYDYRGVADGARVPGARGMRMVDWGARDLPAALEALKREAGPDGETVGIGHSFGGVALGLSGVSAKFRRYALVASMNGYLGRTRHPSALFARMNGVALPLALALGHVPAVGLGTALAGGVFRQWARWCRHPDFLFADPDVPEAARFAEVRIPLLAIGIGDDDWATPAAVGALLERFANADIAERWVGAEEAGRPVGHMGFFRRDMRGTLWPPVADFLLEGRVPQGSTRAPPRSR